ncbi:MAG: hypothetical protein KF752_00115 [Pirellulaceae bacterium]|nr:hypothetical protein [Pirellulaceae bacterium]
MSTALWFSGVLTSTCWAEVSSIEIGRYPQEVSRQLTEAAGISLVDARGLLVDDKGALHVRTAENHLVMDANGSWQVASVNQFPLANQMLQDGDRKVLATDAGVAGFQFGQTQPLGLEGIKVNSLCRSSTGVWVAASAEGLFESHDLMQWNKVDVHDPGGRQWAARDVRAAVYDTRGRLWVGQPAGIACRELDGWRFYEGRDGVPYADFTCAAAGSDGSVWFGTKLGCVGYRDNQWLYRQGPRYIPGDHVRSIAVTADGTVWMATDGGVAGLGSQPMTLSDKARFYEQQIDQYIKRTEYGYTSEVTLKAPGDFSHIIYSDSDNDGLWTAMYGASQCFAVAVTGSDQHKAAARQAFEAIRFLQKVTQGGSPSPPVGYIARTILPTSGHDPNVGRLESDRRFQARNDRLWKVYEPRWPTSADGKWYWKSDTSSDELDGHYFFLPLYYDLVADTDAERERVREVVRDMTDHLMHHNYQMIDVDGTATRWAIFNPENLNQNPDWWIGRGLNSLSMLAYLTVAQHVTGDKKYGQALEELCKKHSYDANAMNAKVQYGIGSGNQSDDEMAFMSFYSLIKYTPNPQLRQTMLLSMYTYWRLMQPERNPFFNFAYAAHGLGQSFQGTHGRLDLNPWGGWLEDSMQTLTGFSLDRLNWSHRNSHRLDLVDLPIQSRVEPGERPRRGRGYLVDGKVLPVENRHFNHWNTDPWRLDYSGDGRQLASGTVFLLPYYMGRYHGFIHEVAK